jgi:hypothetical protein
MGVGEEAGMKNARDGFVVRLLAAAVEEIKAVDAPK